MVAFVRKDLTDSSIEKAQLFVDVYFKAKQYFVKPLESYPCAVYTMVNLVFGLTVWLVK